MLLKWFIDCVIWNMVDDLKMKTDQIIDLDVFFRNQEQALYAWKNNLLENND